MNSPCSSEGARASVFGLGYVGSVTAACLARRGHGVIGCDVQEKKVTQINAGESPIGEPGLAQLIRSGVDSGRLQATTDPAEAVDRSDISFICVGTPSDDSGALDLEFVETVAEQIAKALAGSEKDHALVFRSTMLPGSTRRIAETHFADLIASGRVAVFFFPEFLRQGSALADFENPSLSAIGVLDRDRSPEAIAGSVDPILPVIDNGTEVVSVEEAELLKYACNAFHATKVGFANEIGRIGKAAGVDSAAVMGLLCRDERLNISSYYLRPGTPYGGSCLPKDVSALSHFAKSIGVVAPTIGSLAESNREHLGLLLDRVVAAGNRDVIFLGLAFKANTDDLRGSAMLELAAALLSRSHRVRIFDPEVSPANLIGANERFAAMRLPQLDSVLATDLSEAVGDGPATVVISKRCAGISDLEPLVGRNHHLIDVNGWRELETLAATYEGLCW